MANPKIKGPMLVLDGLRIGYGPITAVQGLDLTIEQGEIIALLGANGAGKSSTLMGIMGLAPRLAGQIRLDGKAIERLSTEAIVRQGLTLVPEGRRVFPHHTVRETLRLGAALCPAGERRAREDRMLAIWPILRERYHQPAGTLSGGEQQQLAIARALMSGPRLLMLDEPSLGLAPQIVAGIFALLTQLREEGLTLLVVEQNVEAALDIADRAYVLSSGECVLQGRPEALRGAAQGDLAAAYLGLAGPSSGHSQTQGTTA